MEKQITTVPLRVLGPRALVALGVFLFVSGIFCGKYEFEAGEKSPDFRGTAVNKAACDFVNSNSGPSDGGCYDACLMRAETIGDGLALDWQKYPREWVNACAVVLNGAEY